MIKDSSNIVRSLYILLNSIRVSSFFRRVLDIFKEDVSCSNLRLKSIDIKGKHQQAEHTCFQWPKFGGGLIWIKIFCVVKSEIPFLIVTKFFYKYQHY
jgi:hypothetical protein